MDEQVYFLLIDDQQAGPYTLTQVQALLESGVVNGDTAFWTEGREDWGTLSELFSVLDAPEESSPSDPATEQDHAPLAKMAWSRMEKTMILLFFGGSIVCLGAIVGFNQKRATVTPSPFPAVVKATPTPVLQIAKVIASPSPKGESATENPQLTPQAADVPDTQWLTPKLAPKGIFFLLRHTGVTTDDGITGLNPGTELRVIADEGFTLHVTDGTHQFDIARNLVTNDIGVAIGVAAQAAENDRQDQFISRQSNSAFTASIKEQKESQARNLAQTNLPINARPFQPGRTVGTTFQQGKTLRTTNTLAASASSILSHNLVNPDNNNWNPLDRGAFNSDLKARSVGRDIQHRLNDIEPAFQAAASEIDSLLKAGQNPSDELNRRYNALYQERESLIQVGAEAYKQSHYNLPQ